MYYIGIDLHKRFMVISVEDESGKSTKPKRIECRDTKAIISFFETLIPFRAVIEASSSYRWLYELLSPIGEVVLAHPLKLRAIVTARAKTDKLDSQVLAKLLRLGWVPRSYIPPKNYQDLRDITRGRARLSREATRAKNELHALLTRSNMEMPFGGTFSKQGIKWLREVDFGRCGNGIRDELVSRLDHFKRELARIDAELSKMAEEFCEVEAISDIHGIGLYSALLIIAEIGEPERFKGSKQVGSYAGLTARVHQSGNHCYHGRISRQGSPWLRWVLVQAAMKVVRRDVKLKNFYTRIRKRSSAKIARVAVARKLAGICWVRLRRWHRERQAV